MPRSPFSSDKSSMPLGRSERQKAMTTPSPSRAPMFDSAPKAVFESSAPPPPPLTTPSVTRTPFFDSPATGTPAPSRTRPSLPPVVANVVERRPVAPTRVPHDTSARKAGIVGAVFGLILVAVFVLAVRLTYRPAQPTGTASQPTTKTTVAKVIPPASSASASQWVPSPGVAAAPTTSVQAPPKGNLPGVARWNAAPGLPAAAKGPARPAEPPSDGVTGGGTFVASPKPAPTPAGTDHPAPDDSAPSLVPVIPQGPPPEVDPLVKAVLEADDPHRK
jgi:hypothetical protein